MNLFLRTASPNMVGTSECNLLMHPLCTQTLEIRRIVYLENHSLRPNVRVSH